MSRLRSKIFPDKKMPLQVWDLEAENFAWIDFFWSTMGRSGEVGKDVDLIYTKLQDRDEVQRLIAPLAVELLGRFGFPERGRQWVFDKFLGRRLADLISMERYEPGDLLTDDFKSSLCAYVSGPVLEQVKVDLRGNIPSYVTFVFGHTHKPFEQDFHFEGYNSEWVKVYNSGGWVVDTPTPQKFHGGAVILADEHLNTATLRMYNEFHRGEDYKVRIGYSTHDGGAKNPFYDRLCDVIESEGAWQDFSSVAAQEVTRRREIIQNKLQKR